MSEQKDADEGELERNIERLLGAARTPPRIDDAARARIEDKLAARQSELVSRRGRSFWRSGRGKAAIGAGALAAAAALILGVSLRGGAPAAVRYENAGPFVKRVVLRDGTEVALDVGAQLIESAPRELSLISGQAVFDVKRGAGRVSIKAGGGEAVAVGTRFWLRADEGAAELAVARGVVSVLAEKSEAVAVGAGEGAAIRGRGPVEVARAARVSHLFDFARSEEETISSEAPGPRGSLIGREPRWGREAPLPLRDLKVDVVVQDGVARTTIDQTFFNDRERQLEGVFSFPVPHGASISRLGMYVDGKLMESAVVGRSEGRDIYEGIVEQRRDPALLEWMGGDAFRMRVFPLPARSEKRVFLSYTERLEKLYDTRRLVVPIPPIDLPAAQVSFKVVVVDGAHTEVRSRSHEVTTTRDGDATVVRYEAVKEKLGKDFVLTLRADDDGAPEAVQFADKGARYVLATARPDLRKEAAPRVKEGPRRVAILVDVSASRSAADLDRQSALTLGLLDALDDKDEVALVTVGHEATTMPGGLVAVDAVDRSRVAGFLHRQGEGLGDSRLDLGVSSALDALGDGAGERFIVYLGDGNFVSDDGTTDAGATKALADRIGGRARFVGVGLGEGVDLGALSALADATSGLAVSVGEDEDLEHRAFDLVAASYTPCVQHLRATVEGGEVLLGAPRLCDGEELAASVRVPGDGDTPLTIQVRGELDGKAWERTLPVDPKSARSAPYLPRLFAEWKVKSLLGAATRAPGDEPSKEEAEIVALAKEHFLVTPFTSLLVLENEAMYAQYKVVQGKPTGWAVYDAPAKIPVVYEPTDRARLDMGGWEAVRRSATRLFWEARPRYHNARANYNLMMLTGIGEGGGGMGFGSGSGRLGGAGSRRPMVERRVTRTNTLRAQLSQDLTPARIGTRGNGRLSGSHRATPDTAFAVAPPATGLGQDWRAAAFEGQQLSAFGATDDPRFQDLTELMPAMFELPVDTAIDLVAAADSPAPASADVEALLAKARARSGPRYRTVDGGQRYVGGADGIVVERRLETGVIEVATLAGTRLVQAYPDLGVRTLRDANAGLVWWLAETAPFAVPPDALLRGLALSREGDHTLRVEAPRAGATQDAGEVASLRYELDDEGRVVRVRFGDGASAASIELRYDAEGVTMVDRAGVVTRLVSDAAVAVTQAPPDLVEIELPLRNPGYWDDRVAASKDASERRRARQQLMATYAALSDRTHLHDTLAALAADRSGPLLRGELALGSLGLDGAPSDRKALLAEAPAGDVVRAYLAAAAKANDSRAFDAIAKTQDGTGAGGGVQMLARLRAGLIDVEQGRVQDASSLGRRLAMLPKGSFFRYVLARRATDAMPWEREAEVGAMWDLLRDDATLAPIADRAALRVWRWVNEHPIEAHARLLRAFDAAMAQGYPFGVDYQVRNVLAAARGDVGVQVFVGRWRAAVLTRGNAEQTLRLLEAALDPNRMGDSRHPEELGPVLRRLAEAPGASEKTALAAATMLLYADKAAEAQRVLAPYVSGPAPSVEALELGSFVAEQQGDLVGATGQLERLLAATQDDALELETLRVWYERLVRVWLRRAALAGTPPEASIEAALRVASRWRREDPGNDAIDEIVGAALYGLGREDEARRVIASIPERRPAEGAAWAALARLVERQGEQDRAIRLWQRARKVEPTNPTWTLSEAQSRLARAGNGDAEAADALLEDIVKGKWQDRYVRVVEDAKRLHKPDARRP